MLSDPAASLNPFPGLRPFGADEKHLFFGREEQTGELLQRLRRTRFLAVVGPSGGGKSSLVRAGLLPELHGGTMTAAGSWWEVVILRPGGDPLTNLAEALVGADFYDAGEPGISDQVRTTLDRSARGLIEAVRQSDIEERSNTLVVVDQFEEIFRFREQGGESTDEAAAFVKLLLEASRSTERAIYVVLTMRSDYLGDCAKFQGLAEAVNQGEYLIPRLTRNQRRTAITGPVQVGGAEVSKRLLTKLLNDVGDDPDQLPVLQHALMRTWDCWAANHRDGEALDLRHYEATGGMQEALSRHADEVFDSLATERLKEIAERAFKSLTEKTDNNRGIRRPMRMQRLEAVAEASHEEVATVINAFRKQGCTFLMPPETTALDARTMVDISHESLMRIWLRLRRWVDDEAQSAAIYRRLVDTAHLHARGHAGLYHDPDLPIAQAWREETRPNAAWADLYGGDFAAAVAFLEKSQTEAEREEREREAVRQRELEQAKALAASQQKAARMFRRFAAAVACALVLAVALSIWAFHLKSQADAASVEARHNAAEAREAQVKVQQQQGSTFVALGKSAIGYRRPVDAQLLAARALGFTGFGRDGRPQAFQDEYPVLLNPESAEWREAVMLAQNPEAPELSWLYPSLSQHPGPVNKVAVHPEGRIAVTGSEKTNLVYVWDLGTGTRIHTLNGHTQDVEALAFSRDGRLLATAADQGDNLLILFATETWTEVRRIPLAVAIADFKAGDAQSSTESFGIHSLTFSPDGRHVVAGDESGALFRVSVEGGVCERIPPAENAQRINRLEYSRDGSLLVSSDEAGSVVLRDPFSLLPQENGVIRPVPTGSPSQDAANRSARQTFAASFALGPDGTWLAACSTNGGAGIWDLKSDPPALSADLTTGFVQGVSFQSAAVSGDGTFLVLSGENPDMKLPEETFRIAPRPSLLVFDVTDPRRPVRRQRLHGHADLARAIASVPNSSRFLSGDEAGLLRLQDAVAPGQPMLPAHAITPVIQALSRDGRWFVSSDESGTVLLWDAMAGRVHAVLPHDDRCRDAVFSADSRTLYTTDFLAGCLRAWDVESGTEKQALYPGKQMEGLDLSPDGSMLVAVSPEVSALYRCTIAPDGDGKLSPAGEIGGASHKSSFVRFLRDGRLVAASDRGQASVFIRAAPGEWKWVQSADVSGQRGLQRLAAGPGPDQIAAVSNNGSVQISKLGADNKVVVDGAALGGADPDTTSFVSSRDGSRFLTTDSGGAKNWTAATRQIALRFPAPKGSQAASGAFFPDGSGVLTANADGSLQLWKLSGAPEVVHLSVPDDATAGAGGAPDSFMNVRGLAFLKEPQTMAVSLWRRNGTNAFGIWNLAEGELTRLLPGERQGFTVMPAPSPDGRFLAASYQQFANGTTEKYALLIWDLAPGSPGPVELRMDSWFNSISWHPDGEFVLTAGPMSNFELWERTPEGKWQASSCRFPPVVNTSTWRGTRRAAFTPDGKRIITADVGTISMYPFEPGERKLGPPKTAKLASADGWVEPSPDGRFLATSSMDSGEIRLWDLESLQPVCAPVKLKLTNFKVRFSPDGRYLAAHGQSGLLILFDVTNPALPVLKADYSDNTGFFINDVAFSPDSRQLAAGVRGAGAIRMIPLPEHSPDLSAWLGMVQFADDASVVLVSPENRSLAVPRLVIPSAPGGAETPDSLINVPPAEAAGKLLDYYVRKQQLQPALAVLASNREVLQSHPAIPKLGRLAVSALRSSAAGGFTGDPAAVLSALNGLPLEPEVTLEVRLLSGDWEPALQALLAAAPGASPEVLTRQAATLFATLERKYKMPASPEGHQTVGVPPALLTAAFIRALLPQLAARWKPDSPDSVVAADLTDEEYPRAWMQRLRPLATALVPAGSAWSYFPADAPAPGGWNQPEFDDSRWPSGPAGIGFGEGADLDGIRTTIPKHVRRMTYYFRHRFTAPDVLPGTGPLRLSLACDDGALVYLNGTELIRQNVPDGPLDDDTKTPMSLDGAAEQSFHERLISRQALRPGSNVLALEAHQSGTNSRDIFLDLGIYPDSLIAEPLLKSGLEILQKLMPQSLSPETAEQLAAAAAPDQASVPGADKVMNWLARAAVRRLTDPPEEELACLQRAADLLKDSTDPPDWRRRREILQRCESLLVSFGRSAEAAATQDAIFATPPRPAALPATQLDLTPFYNASLYDARRWLAHSVDQVPSNLPATIKPVDGITFDLRGIVQLNSGVFPESESGWGGKTMSTWSGRDYPDRVDRIPVGTKCRAIHFIGNVVHPKGSAGTKMGSITFHLAGGASEFLDLKLDENVLDFHSDARAGIKAAWSGRFPNSNQDHHLQMFIWKNPHPDTVVESFDFISAGAPGAPFIMAVTVEPSQE